MGRFSPAARFVREDFENGVFPLRKSSNYTYFSPNPPKSRIFSRNRQKWPKNVKNWWKLKFFKQFYFLPGLFFSHRFRPIKHWRSSKTEITKQYVEQTCALARFLMLTKSWKCVDFCSSKFWVFCHFRSVFTGEPWGIPSPPRNFPCKEHVLPKASHREIEFWKKNTFLRRYSLKKSFFMKHSRGKKRFCKTWTLTESFLPNWKRSSDRNFWVLQDSLAFLTNAISVMFAPQLFSRPISSTLHLEFNF